ncbi:hypothetical protein ACWGOQ_0004585 [Aquimarina sp. M1]
MNLNQTNGLIKMKVSNIKILITILFFGIANLSAFSQSMITERSYLENENGKEITYEAFVSKMDSGKFTMIPLQNDAKEVIGYRLKSLVEIKDKLNKKIASTKIEIGEIVELNVIYHKHILIPVTFNSENESKEAWMIFDTGTFIPVIITNESFKKELGRLESVELNGLKISNPITGTYGLPSVIQQYNDTYTNEIGDKLNGKKIVGIMGYQLLKDYLVSIDLGDGKIYLRNQLTKEKAILSNKYFKVNYRDDIQNIWLPVKINNTEGFAHLDTGYPFTWVEESLIAKKIDSFTISNFDVFKHQYIDYKMTKQTNNYSNLPFQLIANIGNNLLKNFVVTIDSVNKQLFFELTEK